MATAPDVVRGELAALMASATAELAAEVADTPVEQRVAVALATIELLVPDYYDAAGSLAVDWYDELRAEAAPSTAYTPRIIGDPATDWIEREVAGFRRSLDAELLDLEQRVARELDEAAALAAKEVARGYRDTILGNARTDEDAIGWARVTRPGACKFCLMLADRNVYYRAESTAQFAAHGNCHCAAVAVFRNGDHGPEADAVQYLASAKRAKTKDAQAARNKLLRDYLNKNYPEARG